MALAANTVWEIRTGGSDTNGGGFTSGTTGTDFSLQSSKNTSGNNISTTDAVASGGTTITSATAAFTSAIVGNVIYLQGGSASLAAGWYRVMAFTNSTTITIDRVVTSGTGITMNIGGALASIGGCMAAGATTGHVGFLQNNGTAFSVTTATANVAGGVVSATACVIFCGYQTNRTLGNTDTAPTLNYAASGISFFSTRGALYNLTLNANGQTTARPSASTDAVFSRCQFIGMNTANSSGMYYNCIANACSAAVFAGSAAFCVALNCTATAFAGVGGIWSNCIAIGTTGDGFQVNGSPSTVINCVAYNNSGNGFTFTAGRAPSALNCIAEANGGYGFSLPTTANAPPSLYNCAGYNNTSGDYPSGVFQNTTLVGYTAITAGSPFINAASGNFALNNTASRGASLRAASSPQTFPSISTQNYLDIGAAQHQDSGASVVQTSFGFIGG